MLLGARILESWMLGRASELLCRPGTMLLQSWYEECMRAAAREERMMRTVWTIVAVCACLVLGACGQGTANVSETAEVEEAPLTRKPLNDYSWAELKEISERISAAENQEAGRAIAQEFGIVEEDGSLTRQLKQIVLDGTRALDVRVAGIRHDFKGDGSGWAGLSFMTDGALVIRPMNDTATVEGGWEASALRAWLDTEGMAMLEDDLASVIVPVDKPTNNIGRTDSMGSVTVTKDRLFVFSAHEVCGDVHWDSEEFRQRRGYEDIDGILNSEGDQYECFTQAHVTYNSDPEGFLSLADTTGTSPWWYRSAYPFEFWGKGETGTAGYFFQVRESGYPESLGSPEVPASVVIGFNI